MNPNALIPLFQTIVERVISWPVAVLVLFLSFRKPLSSLIRRLVSLKWKGVGVEGELSTSGEAAEQLKADNKDPLTRLESRAQLDLPVPEEIAKKQAEVRAWGGDEPILLSQIQALKDDLRNLQFELNTPDTTDVLLRHLAATQLLQRAETIYRLIFGSQITALRKLDADGPSSLESLRGLYERARKRSPTYFAEYNYEDWLSFLERNRLIIKDGSTSYSITVFGVEFLKFLKSMNVPKKPH